MTHGRNLLALQLPLLLMMTMLWIAAVQVGCSESNNEVAVFTVTPEAPITPSPSTSLATTVTTISTTAMTTTTTTTTTQPSTTQSSTPSSTAPTRATRSTSTTTEEPPTPPNTRVIVCPSDPPHSLAKLLGVSCDLSADCSFLGPDQRCCKKLCRRGVEPSIYEPPHGELLGIRRRCPADTFPETLPVKRCSKDDDCESINRICCPDKKDNLLYCRTAAPIWEGLPFPDSLSNFLGLKTLVGFVQCEPATPDVIDIFSRPCNRTFDCLPNYCCQEGSKKVCRPPKQTILNYAFKTTTNLFG